MSDKNLLLLGLDGLDIYFIERNSDELPHLSEMVESGQAGELDSVLPPVTMPAWGCSASGRRPESVGHFDMHILDSDEGGLKYDFVSSGSRMFPGLGFWNYSDSRMAILDVPCAPVEKLNGYMMGGPFNVSGSKTFPEGLADEIEKNVGDVDLDLGGSEEATREKAFRKFEKRRENLNYFLDNKDADVYFYVFRVTDTLMHHCSSDEQLLKSYKICDEYLGELEERPLDIIVLSDHGAVKTTESYSINTWFRDNGYLEMESSDSGKAPLWKRPLLKAGQKALKLGFKDQMIWLNDRYQSLTGEEFRDTSNFDLDSVDWESTEAFSYMIATCRYAGVWVNDDRFPEPAVEDREEKKKELKKEIEEIDYVEKVLLKEEAFIVDAATFPDLVIVYEEGIEQDNQLRSTPVSEINTYMHRKEGFIGLHGDMFDYGEKDADLIDIAPTVLHYLGDDVPDEMDGKVMDIFAEGSEPEERKVESYSEDVSGLDF